MDCLTEGLNKEDIEEYIARLDDAKAISLAKHRPFTQALKVYKFLLGYGGKQTMQHDEKTSMTWQKIVDQTKRKYLIFTNDDINPEQLGEINLYAIDLMKDELLK